MPSSLPAPDPAARSKPYLRDRRCGDPCDFGECQETQTLLRDMPWTPHGYVGFRDDWDRCIFSPGVPVLAPGGGVFTCGLSSDHEVHQPWARSEPRVGSVVLDRNGQAWQSAGVAPVWRSASHLSELTWAQLNRRYGPTRRLVDP